MRGGNTSPHGSANGGSLAENRVRYRLLVASVRGATLEAIVREAPESLARVPIGPFAFIRVAGPRKARFYLDQERSVEIARDAGRLHAVHEDDATADLMIEVKDWEKGPPLDAVRRFVEVQDALEGQLTRKTVFLFYSESALSKPAAAVLRDAGIMVLDAEKLAGFEAAPTVQDG